MIAILRSYIFCSFYMTGIIWLIQMVQYPSFASIRPSELVAYHRRHSTMMSFLVGPIMVIEITTVMILANSFEAFWLIQASLTATLWGLTFLVSVPIHNRLAAGQQPRLVAQLVMTNWPRTLIWTAKSAMLLAMTRWSA